LKGLREGRRSAAITVTALMKAKDKAEDQTTLQKLKLKIRGRRITRKTIINRGENHGRRNPLPKEE